MRAPREPKGVVEVAPLSHRVGAATAQRALLSVVALLLGGAFAAEGLGHPYWLLVYWVLTGLLSAGILVATRAISVRLFGAALLLDGVMVQYVHEQLGHSVGTDVLLAAHLVGVCLLASFRTGIKLAVWQSLLILFAWRGEESGLIQESPLMGSDRGEVAALDIIMMWVIVMITSTAAAINERELKRRRHDAEALRRLASAFIAEDRPHAVAHRLLQFLIDELDLVRAVVLVRALSPGSDREPPVQLMARSANVPALTAEQESQVMQSALLDLAAGRDGVTPALRLAPHLDPLLTAMMPGAYKVAAIPLNIDPATSRQTVLVCEFARQGLGGGRVERRVVSSVMQASATAALALSRSELILRAQRAAVTDALTGLGNRRAFDKAMADADKAWRESGVPSALVLLDIDRFKSVNDRFGHLIGDEVIKNVARAMIQHAPKSAVLARHGGEEFAMLLPGDDAHTAAAVAERIRLALVEVKRPVRVSASFGVAAVPEDCADIGKLTGVADALLMRAKTEGRDRVVLADHRQPIAPQANPTTPGPTSSGPTSSGPSNLAPAPIAASNQKPGIPRQRESEAVRSTG